MTLMKIGSRYINMDNVAYCYVKEEQLTVRFCTTDQNEPLEVTITAANSPAAIAWLEARCVKGA